MRFLWNWRRLKASDLGTCNVVLRKLMGDQLTSAVRKGRREKHKCLCAFKRKRKCLKLLEYVSLTQVHISNYFFEKLFGEPVSSTSA